MTSLTEKHIEPAIQILDERFIALLGVDRLGACVQIVAQALANAEREGMRRAYEHCAEIVEDHAPGGERYEDYFHENDVAVRIALAAAIARQVNGRPLGGGLTRRMEELLLFIRSYIGEHGVAPSHDEMRDALGLASKSSVHRLIVSLEERGYVDRLPGRARAITLRRHA